MKQGEHSLKKNTLYRDGGLPGMREDKQTHVWFIPI